MKSLSCESRTIIRGLLCVSIMLLGLSMLPIMNTRSASSSHDFQVSFSFTPHDPIRILCDSDFGPSKYNFPGSGTEKDPYVIAGYGITTTLASGISISDTTKYFIIRYCYVNTNYSGILIDDVANGTATVLDNICVKNSVGIYIENSDFCVITYNLLEKNLFYGVFLDSDCDENIIHHNNFVANNPGGIFGSTSQACDHGTTNTWYDTETLEGNYWDDWSGTGSYSIAGEAEASDPFPQNELLNPPVLSVPNNSDMQILVIILSLAIIPLSIITRKRLKNK
ncbi:MAG: NosD domain-containing protein [Candidatus Heimdallarchaeaceae archaeon]